MSAAATVLLMTDDALRLPVSHGPGASEYAGTVVHVASEYWPYARTGGLGEAVLHGETGFLVPPGDAGALAGSIDTDADLSAREPHPDLAHQQSGLPDDTQAIEEADNARTEARRLLDQAEVVEGLLGGVAEELIPMRLAVSHTIAEFHLPDGVDPFSTAPPVERMPSVSRQRTSRSDAFTEIAPGRGSGCRGDVTPPAAAAVHQPRARPRAGPDGRAAVTSAGGPRAI